MSNFDVIGIGNAIVDVIAPAEDTFLDHMGIEKGIMQLVERDRAELLYASMEGRTETPGGSVAMPIRIAVKDGQGVPYSEIETFNASISQGRTSDQFLYRRASVSIPATTDRKTTVLIGFDEGPPRS